ncbi:MAG: MATE family efflux transporter [Clostridia bacterium]|nr:MATE family efflux transporter [Clostridia bacterium]
MEKSVKKAFNRSLLISIITLAWPTMLQELLQTAVQYIDTAMVGSLGTAATAAVGATTTINWLVNSTVSAVGVGFLALISQAYGAGNKDLAKRASSQAVLLTIISGVFFTALCLSLSPFVPVWMQVEPDIRNMAAMYFFVLYSPMLFRAMIIIFGTVLRAVGDTKTPMIVGVVVNIVNVALNFVLIYPTRTVEVFGFDLTLFGAGWGVEGAAAASAIAFVFGGIAITVRYFRHPEVSPKGQSFKFDKSILKPCFKVAFPNALQRFGTCMGYVAFAAMVNSLGEVSTAAHTIANTVESAFYIPGYGMQAAAATLAGNALGARDKDKIKALCRMLIIIEVLLMIISGGLLFIFAPSMMTLFSKDALVIALGSQVLRMVALTEPFFGFSIIVEGMMQGMGKTVMPFVANILGMWGVRILGTFLCTQVLGYGLVSAWGCMILHNLLLFVMFAAYLVSGRYNPLNKKSPKIKNCN